MTPASVQSERHLQLDEKAEDRTRHDCQKGKENGRVIAMNKCCRSLVAKNASGWHSSDPEADLRSEGPRQAGSKEVGLSNTSADERELDRDPITQPINL